MNRRRCDGIERRAILRFGLTALGIGVSSAFRGRLAADERSSPRAKNCILLWLDGGPSHLDTFDPKPDAPSEVRGPFASIATKVPGVRISELLPRTAQVLDKIAIVRSMTSPLGEHGLANRYLLTGYKPSPALEYPSFGSVTTHLRDESAALPSSVAIPELRSSGAGFLGTEYEPFAVGADPAKPDFRVRDLDLFPGIDVRRLARRREYLAEFDAALASLESSNAQADAGFDAAYRLVASSDAKNAFDIAQEPAPVRQRYGPRTFGQSCLLARRLVERGVSFVTVSDTGWDTHGNLPLTLRDGYSGADSGVGLVPTFDLGFAALIEDLDQRGLLDETLVIAMGEFGRTPKINAEGGRDHWPRAFSAVVAGGGVSGGQTIGSSDRVGESPKDDPVTPEDFVRTIYVLLGIDPDLELLTPEGRPIRVNQGGRIVASLI